MNCPFKDCVLNLRKNSAEETLCSHSLADETEWCKACLSVKLPWRFTQIIYSFSSVW